MMPLNKFLCLNPDCPSTSQSVFTPRQINLHKRCLTWIITSEGPLNMPPLKQLPLKEPTSIVFGEGMHSIYQILELKEWPQQLTIIFQQIKQRTLNEIEKVKNQKIKEFNQLYKMASKVVLQSKQLFQSLTNYRTQPVSGRLPSLKSLLRHISASLYQPQKVRYAFQKHLLRDIRLIGDLVQSFGENYQQAEKRRRKQAIDKTNYFLFQRDDIQVSEKIQKLARTFKVQMMKATYDSQLGSFKTICWICNSLVESERRDPSKLKCLQQMFFHLTTCHRKEVYLNFMSKVLRYEIEEISFQVLTHKIHSEKIEQVIIVDRENAGNIQRPLQIERNKIWIEVVNKDNKNLPKGLFIVANSNSKDASDILITFLVYEILKAEVGKVVLITQDHFATTLQQVIGGNRLVCIKPKDYIEKINNSNFGQMSE